MKNIDKRMCPHGLFSVTRHDRGCKKTWVYTYPSNNHIRRLSSVSLRKLRKKVEEKGLPWIVVDMEKAKQAYDIDKERICSRRQPKYIHRDPTKPLSGVKHVSRTLNPDGTVKYWVYIVFKDGKRVKSFSSKTLLELEARVLRLGFDWIIVDKETYHQNLDKEGGIDG